MQIASLSRAAFRIADLVQRQQQATDRIRRAAAVVEHVGKRRVARDVDVLRERGQQIAEHCNRQGMRANGVRKLGEGRLLRRFAAFDRVETPRKPRERRVPHARRRRAFVGDVVGGAGEAVDRDDGAAVVLRQQHRRDREIFVMTDRQAMIPGESRVETIFAR